MQLDLIFLNLTSTETLNSAKTTFNLHNATYLRISIFLWATDALSTLRIGPLGPQR